MFPRAACWYGEASGLWLAAPVGAARLVEAPTASGLARRLAEHYRRHPERSRSGRGRSGGQAPMGRASARRGFPGSADVLPGERDEAGRSFRPVPPHATDRGVGRAPQGAAVSRAPVGGSSYVSVGRAGGRRRGAAPGECGRWRQIMVRLGLMAVSA